MIHFHFFRSFIIKYFFMLVFENPLEGFTTLATTVLPKHTLFKVLYFILAKFKNYTLYILYFNQILYKYFIMG